MKVAVLGAGINGVASGLKIKEKYRDCDVTIISDVFTPNTTGDGSGGLWYPYLCGNTPEEQLAKWGGETYQLYHKLWQEGGHDVNLLPVCALYSEAGRAGVPAWARQVFGYAVLSGTQLEYCSRRYNGTYRSGITFTTFIVNPPTIISHLYQRYSILGGKVLRATVSSLRDPLLKEYDVVVNCTGLGAKTIVPDDEVVPIRGQIFRVSAQWQNEALMNETSGHYILPNTNFCVLGGTHQEGDFNTKADPKDAEFIIDGCSSMVPGFKSAIVQTMWVGLRPGRTAVRLEPQTVGGKLVIHNYGHGGSGLTLFWGCASQVLEILDRHYSKSKI